MKFKAGKLCFVLGFVLALADLSVGQTIISSIVGQVTDTTGAAIPNAQIVITNQGTGISVEAATDSTGSYSVPNLYAGVYTVQAKKEGFETVRFPDIQVLAAQSVRRDVVLKVGLIQQQITVSGGAPLVHTDSINVAGELSTRQLTELPMATLSVDTALMLIPGSQMQGQIPDEPETGGAIMYGGSSYNINGIAAQDAPQGRGAIAYGNGMVALPGNGSLQEFKFDVGNMNAEYRAQTSISLITKQGANKFHGTAFEYNMNAKLEAQQFLLNAEGVPKAPFNLNQFGGNLGGPIWKNKAFFFFNFGGFRQRQYSTGGAYGSPSVNVPSAAMHQGNFGTLCATYDGNGICTDTGGTQLYNPFTGLAFPYNQIPAGLITSQAKTLSTYYPVPTTPGSLGLPNGAPNFVGLVSSGRDYDDYEVRLDWQLSTKDSLAGFFTHNVGNPWAQPRSPFPNYDNGENFGYKTILYHIAETHVFSSNTINDLRVGWLDFPQIRSGQNTNFDPRSLFPQQPVSAQRGLPNMSIGGYGGIGDYGLGIYSYQPSLEILENFTHVHGRHTLKAGVDFTFYHYFSANNRSPLPGFSFSGIWTGNKGNPGQPQSVGNAFADFLLGVGNSSSTGLPGHDTSIFDRDYEFYFQDNWQATHKLTIYLGLRYVLQMPWTDRNELQSGYDFNTNKIVLPENSMTPTLPPFGAGLATFNALLPYMTTTKALGWPLQYIKTDTNNWGPRVGFAFRPFENSKTVVRGGYGVYYAFAPAVTTIYNDIKNPPWSGGTPLNFQSALPGQPTSQFLPDITFSNPFPSAAQSASPVSPHPNLYPWQRNFVLPVTQTWNLTLERQIGANDMVRATYLGTQTHHISIRDNDLNIPTVQTPNMPTQEQRPYQPWGAFSGSTCDAKQNYDQLQLEYIRHWAQGLSVQVEYQWTRALTNSEFPDGGYQVPAYPRSDYGENAFVLRHMLVFDYIYELPAGRGKHWLSNAHGVVDGLLGGWQVAGISTYQTGFPFTVNFSTPSNYVGWWGGRADRVSGVSLYDKQSGHDVVNGVNWFNASAFAPPQPWAWGNSQPYSVFGPGTWNWDISAQKNFRIPIRGLEEPRLQFRADFFDAFNHFNLGGIYQYPNSTIADTRDGGPAIPSAGKLYSGNDYRTIQLGLRFTF